MSQHKRTIRTLSHSFYDLKYHLVWTPKYRGKVLSSDKIKSELRRIFESICETLGNCRVKYSRRSYSLLSLGYAQRFYFIHYANNQRKIIGLDEKEN